MITDTGQGELHYCMTCSIVIQSSTRGIWWSRSSKNLNF